MPFIFCILILPLASIHKHPVSKGKGEKNSNFIVSSNMVYNWRCFGNFSAISSLSFIDFIVSMTWFLVPPLLKERDWTLMIYVVQADRQYLR